MKSRFKRIAVVLLIASIHQISLAQEPGGYQDHQITIQTETNVRLTLQSEINSKLNATGDTVAGTLAEPLYVDGQLALPRGSEFRGRITRVTPAKRGQRSSIMSIEIDRIITSRGEVPVSAQVTEIDDWETEQSIKANSKGELKGGLRGGKTIDNTYRGGRVGSSGGVAAAGLAGAAGASARLALGFGAAGVAVGMISGLLLTKGSDIRVRPGAILRIKFTKAATLPAMTAADSFSR